MADFTLPREKYEFAAGIASWGFTSSLLCVSLASIVDSAAERSSESSQTWLLVPTQRIGVRSDVITGFQKLSSGESWPLCHSTAAATMTRSPGANNNFQRAGRLRE